MGEAGVPMAEARSLGRIRPRWTALRRTSAGRWPSPWSRADCASVRWCSSPTPLALFLETYGTEQGALSAEDITNVLKMEFDCRPGAIAMSLALREPITKDGIKFFEWENAKD